MTEAVGGLINVGKMRDSTQDYDGAQALGQQKVKLPDIGYGVSHSTEVSDGTF